MTDPTPTPPLRLIAKPPINLPSFTFLLGDTMNCHMLAEELSKQNPGAYVEDFHAPVYEAVECLYALPNMTTHYDVAMKYAKDVMAIRNAVPIDLVAAFMARAEDLLSFHPYQFIVRDAEGFTLPRLKDSIAVNVNDPAIFTNYGQDKLVLPPGADLVVELRNLLG